MPFVSRVSNASPRHGFTLIELLVVLGVLGLFATIALSYYIGGRGQSKVDKAKADMQVIQLGLEAYRARFGDYPRFSVVGVANSEEKYLLNALFGRIGPAHQEVSDTPPMVNSAVLSFANGSLPLSSLVSNMIVDPWGNAYRYDSTPTNAASEALFGYLLDSAGPDGAFGNEDDIVAD